MFRSGKVISHIYHMIDCVQHSTSVLIHDLWNPSEKKFQKISVTIFSATFSIKAFFKITVEQHIKTSKGSRSNWMLKDEHKHWKVKTVTALPHSVRWTISLRAEAHATSVNWRKILAAAIHEPAGWWIRHKNSPEFSPVSLPAGKWAMGKLKFENSIL